MAASRSSDPDGKELQALRDQLLHVESEVRAQIARDLHDGPVQQVAAAGLHLMYIRRAMERAPHLLPGAINDLDDQLARTMTMLRSVMYELRPPGIAERGLYQIVKEYVAYYQATNDIQVRLEIPDTLGRLPEAHQYSIFFMLQEALINVRKHAQATVTSVTFRDEDTGLCIEISDNGHGFDSTATPFRSSFGLTGMRERVERLGGTLQVDSVQGKGTHVRIWVPFSRATYQDNEP